MKRVHRDMENWRTERWRTQERIKIPRGGINSISFQLRVCVVSVTVHTHTHIHTRSKSVSVGQ